MSEHKFIKCLFPRLEIYFLDTSTPKTAETRPADRNKADTDRHAIADGESDRTA